MLAIAICLIVVLENCSIPRAQALYLFPFADLFDGIAGNCRDQTAASRCGMVCFPPGSMPRNPAIPRTRSLLLAAMIFIARVGWFGTVSRRYYAAPRFIEPWNNVAKQMAEVVREGGTVFASHPSFLFYLNYQLNSQEKQRCLNLAGIYPYQNLWPGVYSDWAIIPSDRLVGRNVFMIKDVSSGDAMTDAELYLQDNCTLKNDEKLLPDSGFGLKEHFLPTVPRVRYRIEILRYNCAASDDN